ncbi:hypothetical protein BLNAU_8088 [Blattamonas nauphoetae]|uniref:Uncharacterized protein n=1 Tax=Blattamonas nauphoetae TaxID=2049346 RepID=A0ABQ9XZW3_9EUKA|nr:hypothetical protein BLNAU_8088 [Blattamonas nauphoetae]
MLKCFQCPKAEQKRIRLLKFERALKPAKRYLQFILQREEFVPEAKLGNYDLSSQIGHLLGNTLELERDLFEVGEIVETGREEWEVGWLVEKTTEDELGEKLRRIREDDVRMNWKHVVEKEIGSGESRNTRWTLVWDDPFGKCASACAIRSRDERDEWSDRDAMEAANARISGSTNTRWADRVEETQHRWDSASPLARSEEAADETVECSARLAIDHIPKHIAQTNSRDWRASVHHIDSVADPDET